MVGENVGQYRTFDGLRYRKLDHNLLKREAIALRDEYKATHPKASVRLVKIDGRYFVFARG